MRYFRLSLALLPFCFALCFFIANLFAREPSGLKPRVFVIGLSKTGTTSIGDALEILGYRRLGWRDIRSRHMVHTWANGDNAPLVELTKHYDAFEDLPWPFLYRDMADLYPDAKFILSLRRNEKTWLRSMERHVGRGKWLPYAYFYGADVYEGNEDVILRSYQNHTANVREYFRAQPERLIELNIDDGGDANWELLCRLAQCPGGRVPSIAFPRANTAAHWELPLILHRLHWFWSWLVTRIEEQSSFYYYRSGSNLLRPILSAFWRAFDVLERAGFELYFNVWPMISQPLKADPAMQGVRA